MPVGSVVPRLGQVAVPEGVSAALQGTESAKDAIQRVKYSHDAMIDMIIANPAITQNRLAQMFGFTPAWISRVYNSDAFQARLAARKSDIIDPALVQSIEEKFKAMVDTGLNILVDKLHATQSVELALKTVELGQKALGYGARQQNVNVQNNFVVAMPQQAASAEEWASKYSPAENLIADVTPKG